MSSIKICNFNCICNKETCEYKHLISYDKRIALNSSLSDIENIDDYRKEEFSMIRKVPCNFGCLCNNKSCNFKHGFNFSGRELIIEKFNEIKDTIQKKEEKPKICFKNCLCEKTDCSYQHYLSFKQRLNIISILQENPEISEMIEEKDSKRVKMCIYGQVCNRENCTFKHGYNIDGRKIFIQKLKELKEFKEVKK